MASTTGLTTGLRSTSALRKLPPCSNRDAGRACERRRAAERRDAFANVPAQLGWTLRNRFEGGVVTNPDDPELVSGASLRERSQGPHQARMD
jgi:hypothetical protein